MEEVKGNSVEGLNEEDLARFVLDVLHRAIIHHGLWFSEVIHQLGLEEALQILEKVKERSIPLQAERLRKALDLPRDYLSSLPRERLVALLDALALNWLANDGIWFQAVEFSRDMNDAKRCNDTCWTRFSPCEARAIKGFLKLPWRPGLEGLKKALKFRLYARINVQSIEDEGPQSFIFYMNDCRVQSARRRQGLADYPCKSAGLVEYGRFAEFIDDRIRCECLACPPDPHPEGWFCAWRFSLQEG
ncbi:MAG TPA: DUF6125 family protein [Syntrophales bacterium]|nr:DUF6125 family protein [Syntrophales bacterium]HOL59576.1 DUF6125 family protein [Syntrophales bacterium]HPO35666.1 DUF6125 family protein [Syntrophales bacterium]